MLEEAIPYYEHLGKLIKASVFKISENSYYMVITDQDKRLYNMSIDKLRIRSYIKPYYDESTDTLYIRGKNELQHLRAITLDFDALTKVIHKLKKLEEEFSKKATITVSITPVMLDSFTQKVEMKKVITSSEDVLNFERELGAITTYLKREL